MKKLLALAAAIGVFTYIAKKVKEESKEYLVDLSFDDLDDEELDDYDEELDDYDEDYENWVRRKIKDVVIKDTLPIEIQERLKTEKEWKELGYRPKTDAVHYFLHPTFHSGPSKYYLDNDIKYL